MSITFLCWYISSKTFFYALYVVVSRVTFRKGSKMQILDDETRVTLETKIVVCSKIFDNVQYILVRIKSFFPMPLL